MEILKNDYEDDPQIPYMIALLVSVGDYTSFLRMMREYKNNPEAFSVSYQQDVLIEASEMNVEVKSLRSQRAGSVSKRHKRGVSAFTDVE